MSSRIGNLKRNIIFSYVSNIVYAVLGFISRTVFLHYLSVEYIGVNSLFQEILGLLTLAELGIPTAMNFELYKPVAYGDKERIKSILLFYKKAYRCVAGAIALFGLILLPFLDIIVKDPGNIGDIRIYYLIFLFNTVITYFVSYKYSIANAEQKLYIMSNIETVTQIITVVMQIMALAIFKNYLIFLLVISACGIFKLVFASIYFDKRYPILKEPAKELDKQSKKDISRNIRGLICYKVGEVCIHQTDNIIISTFINIVSVGLISNYVMIINKVCMFINTLFTSALPGLGNLVATTDKDKQIRIFKIYNYLDFWIYGFSSIAFYILLTPTIRLWLGDSMIIDEGVVLLLCINIYLTGQRISFLNFKTACGSFIDDKYIPLLAAAINIVTSIYGAMKYGLLGVYIGTLLSGLFLSIMRPAIGYKRITGDSCRKYFEPWTLYSVIVIFAGGVTKFIVNKLTGDVNFTNYLIRIGIVAIVPNVIFLIITGRREEYRYVINHLKNRIMGIYKKHD